MNDRTGILVILDGFGVNLSSEHNAISHAQMPSFKSLWENFPHTTLEASERFVGLPAGFMGNSEVGHLNIGAGRVVYQDFSLISRAIEDGSFFKNSALLKLIERVHSKKGAALHLMGLLSDGGVHSHISHLFALLRLARDHALEKVWIHAFTDGRDTSPTGAGEYISRTLNFCKDAKTGEVATVSGRFYAMDRDKRWDRTEKAYQAVISANCERTFSDPLDFIRESYNKGVTDEFTVPGVADNYPGVNDGDGIVFFNFRADRARQLTRACCVPDFKEFVRSSYPTLAGFATMTPYDESVPVPALFEKPKVKNTLGEVISQAGKKQLRIAETEKYAHVTYFFNGGEEKAFVGEKRLLVPSPRDVQTYDLKPAMSANEVVDLLLIELEQNRYQFVVVNFTNPDMVGHTGNFGATISALETVDGCLKKIIDWVSRSHSHPSATSQTLDQPLPQAFLILTADHGNCELMRDPSGNVLTSHTLLPVPFILFDPRRATASLASKGSLCDIAPTLLSLWEISPPKEMTGHSLLLES